MLNRLTTLHPAMSPNEIRQHMRIVGDEESPLISSYILAAQDEIQRHAERSLVTAQFELVLPRWPTGSTTSKRLPFDEGRFRCVPGAAIYLEMPPVNKISEVIYYDPDGVQQSLDVSDLDLCNVTEPCQLRPEQGTFWPAVQSRWDAVRIKFWAGSVAPLAVDADADRFTSVSGYPFANGEALTLSKSGNSNPYLGDVAVLPTGTSANTTYYVVNASGSAFQIAETAGGTAVSLGLPSTSGQAIDLIFAGELQPLHRLVLMQMVSRSWTARCAEGTCACGAEAFMVDPLLRKMKWRSPVDFV